MNLIVTPHTKINSKGAADTNLSAQAIKLLEELVVENLHNLGLGKAFLDSTSKAQSNKEKIDKLDFIKIKTFAPQSHY